MLVIPCFARLFYRARNINVGRLTVFFGELCIKNDECCIKNDEFCIKNDDLGGVSGSFATAEAACKLIDS